MSELSHIKTTLGAILVGCVISTALSGMTIVQTYLYFRLYPKDQSLIKLMVIGICLLDITHAALMCASTWDFLIVNFGNEEISDRIPMTIGLTVTFTAMITFFTQIFFSHRVFRLSRRNWYITAPLVILSCTRLGAAMVSTTEMGKLKRFSLFVEKFGYVFTLGLAMACIVDVGITAAMCYYLHKSRTGFEEMDNILDTIMLYTLNDGALTCVATVLSMICWLAMPRNLIFLGLHFTISKLYANSLLATFNIRCTMRNPSKADGDVQPLVQPSLFQDRSKGQFQSVSLLDDEGEDKGEDQVV